MPIKIEAHPTATGIFSIGNPNSSTSRAITLPDASTELVGTNTVQTLTNKSIDSSQLTGNVAPERLSSAFNATGSAPYYACRSWVNFNGTGTVAIRAAGNVTSITDNGVGDYTVNFTTPMPDENYSALGTGSNNFSGYPPDFDLVTLLPGSVRFLTRATGGSVVAQDPVYVCFSIFR